VLGLRPLEELGERLFGDGHHCEGLAHLGMLCPELSHRLLVLKFSSDELVPKVVG